MKVYLLILGQIASVFGILLLFFPKLLIKLSEYSNQSLNMNQDQPWGRYFIGIVLTMCGIFLLYQSHLFNV